MSQRAYPWLKLMKDTKRDPKIRKLTLEQQAVFYNLLQHAGLQDEEGAFDDTDRTELALEVADEREDILTATVDRLLSLKILTRLPDGRLAFSAYEKNQASSKDVNAARQRRFYQRQKESEGGTDLTPPDADRQAPDDIEKEEEKEIGQAGSTTVSQLPNAHEESQPAAAVCQLLEIPEDSPGAKVIARAIGKHPDLEHLAQAEVWQAKQPKWREKPPGERAVTYDHWLAAEDRHRRKQAEDAARASPNSRPPPLPDIPPDPETDEMNTHIREHRIAKANERYRRHSSAP